MIEASHTAAAAAAADVENKKDEACFAPSKTSGCFGRCFCSLVEHVGMNKETAPLECPRATVPLLDSPDDMHVTSFVFLIARKITKPKPTAPLLGNFPRHTPTPSIRATTTSSDLMYLRRVVSHIARHTSERHIYAWYILAVTLRCHWSNINATRRTPGP